MEKRDALRLINYLRTGSKDSNPSVLESLDLDVNRGTLASS